MGKLKVLAGRRKAVACCRCDRRRGRRRLVSVRAAARRAESTRREAGVAVGATSRVRSIDAASRSSAADRRDGAADDPAATNTTEGAADTAATWRESFAGRAAVRRDRRKTPLDASACSFNPSAGVFDPVESRSQDGHVCSVQFRTIIVRSAASFSELSVSWATETPCKSQ